MIKWDDLNYIRFKLIKVENVINMVKTHEQGGTDKSSKVEQLRTNFG
jgi:hypothetical protein